MDYSIYEKHYRKCHLCEAMCGLEVTWNPQSKEVIKIKGDAQDSFSRGYHCIKAEAIKDIHVDPDRLHHPVKRFGDQWIEISWDEALTLAAQGIHRVQSQGGNNSFATYLGNPCVHDAGIIFYTPSLLKAINSQNNYSATSLDQLPHHLASMQMLGHQYLLPVPDLESTSYFLLLGGNPVVSRGSLMTAPDIKERFAELQRRGGKLVVVDPRRTETAAIADEYIAMIPGRDAAFLMVILATIFQEGLESLDIEILSVEECRKLKKLVMDWNIASLSKYCGVPLERIVNIAQDFAASSSAVCYGRMGVSTQRYGALCQWLIYTLNMVSGNFDKEGGMMFPLPVIELTRFLSKGKFANRHSRCHQLPASGGEFPTSTLADEILNLGTGQVKGLLTIAGNPAISAPNSRKMTEALSSLDFMVSIDFYINETTKHAHLILPPVSPLQRSQFDIVFQALSIRNNVAYAPALFEKEKNQMHSWEIILALEKKLTRLKNNLQFAGLVRQKIMGFLGPEGIANIGILLGPYSIIRGNWRTRLTLGKVEKHIRGLDLGSLQPRLKKMWSQSGKKINLLPEVYLRGLEQFLQSEISEGESSSSGFYLIGRRSLKTNNSWSHNSPLLSKGKRLDHALMHVEDLKELGIDSGQLASIRSDVGEITIKVVGIQQIMRGVISIPHGFGHDQSGTRIGVASLNPGVNVNILVNDRYLDTLSGNAVFNGQKVQVVPIKNEQAEIDQGGVNLSENG